jgi:fructose-1,6-bisphosphatase class II
MSEELLGEDMQNVNDLADYFRLACERAAIASHHWRGKGDGKAADAAAVEAMRLTFNNVPFDGRVAIGEGERDEAPMLYIGEPLGNMRGDASALKIDIAVDPLECTNNCATNSDNSIAVLAAAPRGSLLHAPDCYMDKICGGEELAGEISLDGGVEWNLQQVASVMDKPVSEVRVVALDRERHAQLFSEIRAAGAQLHLMGDGDISAAIWAADPNGPHDLLMGIGAAPEGVITATAIRGLGGVFEGRLQFRHEVEEQRAMDMIGGDLQRLWTAEDLCTSTDAIFVASGVCPGYLPGVEEINGNYKVTSQVIDVKGGKNLRFETTHEA